MKPLTPSERRALRAQAHHLDPVVIVGHHGVTPAVLHEIDLALLKHELVKVRVASDDRAAREAALAQVAEALACAPVQHLGKVLVLWRPNPEKKKPEAPAAPPARAPRAAKKPGPRAPVDPVRQRRRTARAATEPKETGKGRRGAARNAPPAAPADASRARRGSPPGGVAPAKPGPRSRAAAAPAPRARGAAAGDTSRRRRSRG